MAFPLQSNYHKLKMNKSLLVFFAVIAVASAIRLPIDIKAAVDRIQHIHQKDAGYESDKVPMGTYESEAMADEVPEVAAIVPHPPVALNSIRERIENLRQVPDVPEEVHFESEHMADPVFETKDMADQPFETVAMKDEYENEAMADVVPEGTHKSEAMADEVPEVAAIAPHPPAALNSIRERIENLRQVPDVPEEVHFESEHMADPVFETKDMADQPFETVAMKDEYENEAMADESPALLESVIEKIESIVQKETPEIAQEEVQEAENAAESFYGNADLSEEVVARRLHGEEKFAKMVAAMQKLAQYF